MACVTLWMGVKHQTKPKRRHGFAPLAIIYCRNLGRQRLIAWDPWKYTLQSKTGVCVYVWANEWEKVNHLIWSFRINFHKYAHTHKTLTLITFRIQSKRFRCNALSHCLHLSLSLLYIFVMFETNDSGFCRNANTFTQRRHTHWLRTRHFMRLHCVTRFSTASASSSSVILCLSLFFSDKNFTIGITGRFAFIVNQITCFRTVKIRLKEQHTHISETVRDRVGIELTKNKWN